MNTELRALEAHLRSKSPYRRIFEAYRVMFGEDEYAALGYLRRYRDEVDVIDQINFSRELFVDPLPMGQLVRAVPIEPGYGTSSGELELGQLVKEFETHRADAYLRVLQHDNEAEQEVSLAGTTVAIGSGVTGCLALAIASVAEFERSQGGSRRRVYYSIPGYGMVDEIARTFSLVPVPFGQPLGSQLPSLSDLLDSFDSNALAYVLTFPTNPSQSCYTSEDADLLRQLVRRCQKDATFLIVDTIFQDMRWSGEPAPEVFSLGQNSRYLVKTFGPSKDTPFACGLRIGYMIGDARLKPYVDRISSVLLNSHNFYSKLWLGLDLLLRNGVPSPADLKPFQNNFILGNHGRRTSAEEMHRSIIDAGICDNYQKARQYNSRVLDTELAEVHRYLLQSEHFCVGPRPRFGNILLVRLTRPDAFESEYEFFLRGLFEANVGLLVGGVFGVPEDCGEISFRVVVAAEEAKWVINKLQRIEALL